MSIEEFESKIDEFPPNKRKMLIAISKGLSVEAAAQECDLDKSTFYKWQHEEDFKELVKEARNISVERIEAVLELCAHKSVTDPRYQTSLIFLLKTRKREIYGDHVVQEIDAKVNGMTKEEQLEAIKKAINEKIQ